MTAAILLFILFLSFLGGLTYLRWKESNYLKKKTKEAMSKSLKIEVEKEQEDAKRRKKSFEEQLKKYGL